MIDDNRCIRYGVNGNIFVLGTSVVGSSPTTLKFLKFGQLC